MRNFAKSIRKYPLLTERLSLIIFIFFCVSCVGIIMRPSIVRIYHQIFPQNWCKNYELRDNFSCGEESLFRLKNNNNTEPQPTREFESAFTSWKNGEFQKAADFFGKHRKQNLDDPEALIYFNNAKLMQEKSYTIAVIVPANLDIAKNMLRGAAQVQEDFNNDRKNPGSLKIIIANDENNPDKAEELTRRLLSKQDIIAVIGHYSSDIVAKALPVYQERKVVLISAASATREDILDGHKKYESNFLFKTNTDVTHQMDKLIEALKTLGINIPQDKVAIFYNKTSIFSKSAFNYLQSKFGQNAKNKIIEKQILIDNQQFSADNELNDVKQKGAKALIPIPDPGSDQHLNFTQDTSGNLLWQNQAPEIDQEFKKLIDNLMKPNRKDRPQNTQQILQLIDRIENGKPPDIPTPPPPYIPTPVKPPEFRPLFVFSSVALNFVFLTLPAMGVRLEEIPGLQVLFVVIICVINGFLFVPWIKYLFIMT